MHGELYLHMAKLSSRRGKDSDARALIESAILNFMYLDGMFSFKLAECYAMLAESEPKVEEAISHYLRAKKIIENESMEEQPSYLNIIYKLA